MLELIRLLLKFPGLISEGMSLELAKVQGSQFSLSFGVPHIPTSQMALGGYLLVTEEPL